MPDGADQRVGVAVGARQRAAEQRVGLARAVDVGGDDGVDAVAGADEGLEPGVLERLAEVHEPAAAPGADGRGSQVLHGHQL